MRATAQKPSPNIISENAVRYGILMGGPKEILSNGIGEYSVGHDFPMPRRRIIEFIGINVGRKNESEAALADDSHTLHQDWHLNPERVSYKSPARCAVDVKQTFGAQGFIIPPTLVGMEYDEAEKLLDSVLPLEISEKPLVDVIEYLQFVDRLSDEANKLRDELLSGAEVARSWLSKQVLDLKAEMDRSRTGQPGLRGLDNVQKEYFRELREPLPEEVPALATLAMGRELGKQFAANASGGSKTDLLLEQLIEQNKLQAEANRLLQEKLASSTGGDFDPKHSKQTAADSAKTTKGK